MAGACEPFEFSLRSASIDHYIERNESSSPALPIVIDIRCEIRETSDYCSSRFIRCSVRQVSKEGLKHSNRAQIALARQLGSVCAAVFDCGRSCILAATASARPMLSFASPSLNSQFFCPSSQLRQHTSCPLQSTSTH